MKKIKLYLLLILICISFNGYTKDSLSINNIKHLELISEISDSMALINKKDIDVINNTFYKYKILDSLNNINDTIIKDLKLIINDKDSIIYYQKDMIHNDTLIKDKLTKIIDNNDKIINSQEKELKKERNKKNFWKTTTGISLTTLIIILIL